MTIELREKTEYLNVVLSETFHFDTFIKFIMALGEENAVKYLIDGTKLENTNLSYKERFDIGNTAVEYLDIKAKYVVIWPARDINYFAISVMKLRGFNVQVYHKLRTAEKWLLK